MDKLTSILRAVLPKSLTKQQKDAQYSHVPKEEESFTEEDYEFGGKAYMLGEDNDDKKEGETNEQEDAKKEPEDIDINDKKGKTSSLQAAWNISNLIQGKCIFNFRFCQFLRKNILALAIFFYFSTFSNLRFFPYRFVSIPFLVSRSPNKIQAHPKTSSVDKNQPKG